MLCDHEFLIASDTQGGRWRVCVFCGDGDELLVLGPGGRGAVEEFPPLVEIRLLIAALEGRTESTGPR